MALGGLAAGLLPEWARSANAPGLSATRSTPKSRYDIKLGRKALTIGGESRDVLTFNGTVPGPLVHLRRR